MSAPLYIIATPIGHLSDISARALATLEKVSLILAEDTRVSRKLLSHYGIVTPCQSFHDFNEQQLAAQCVNKLLKGEAIALISDAGTPLISDPGYHLVRQAQQAGIQVTPIPGPCAAIAALSVSGLATDRFQFEGFLPAKAVARQKRLKELVSVPHTLIFYEAPHRLIAMMNDLAMTFGEQREAVIAKELTKQYELVLRLPIQALCDWLAHNEDKVRGEFVVLVAGAVLTPSQEISDEVRHILQSLMSELSLKQSVKLAAQITGVHKNTLYEYAIHNQSPS